MWGGPVHDQPRLCRSVTLDGHASMPRALKTFFGKIKSWWPFFTVIELESIPVIVFAWRLLSVSVLSHHSLKFNVLFAIPYLTVLFGWARGILTHVPNPANYPFLPLIFYFPHTLICLREKKVGPVFLSLLEDGPAICLVFQPGAPASLHTPPPFTALSHANQFPWLLLSSSHTCCTHSLPPIPRTSVTLCLPAATPCFPSISYTATKTGTQFLFLIILISWVQLVSVFLNWPFNMVQVTVYPRRVKGRLSWGQVSRL